MLRPGNTCSRSAGDFHAFITPSLAVVTILGPQELGTTTVPAAVCLAPSVHASPSETFFVRPAVDWILDQEIVNLIEESRACLQAGNTPKGIG